MKVVPCLLLCGIKFALGAIAAYVRTESLYISGEV